MTCHDGHQPFSSPNQDVWITFNGEIYNFQELRKTLENKGHIFRTKSDTEVIVHAYLEFGEDCLSHLRGMFSFVIYDKRKQVLFGARDRFGIKPFYYYQDNNQLVWGSEIKVIMAANGVEKNIQYQGLDDYLTYGYILGDRSIYQGVKKLEPGHSFKLNLDDGSFKIKKYWDIHFDPEFLSFSSGK